MNAHVPEYIINKWPSHEFIGKPRKSQLGLVYIEAKHKILQQGFYYVFGADSCIDMPSMKCGAPELIFDDIEGLNWANKYFPE